MYHCEFIENLEIAAKFRGKNMTDTANDKELARQLRQRHGFAPLSLSFTSVGAGQ